MERRGRGNVIGYCFTAYCSVCCGQRLLFVDRQTYSYDVVSSTYISRDIIFKWFRAPGAGRSSNGPVEIGSVD